MFLQWYIIINNIIYSVTEGEWAWEQNKRTYETEMIEYKQTALDFIAHCEALKKYHYHN